MIKLKPDTERQLAASIQRYFAEHLDEELDDLGGTCYEPEFGYWKK